VIRTIRFLGAAFGILIGLTLASLNGGLFADMQYGGAFLAAWVIAWIVIGFAVFPYLTIVPAGWLLRQVQQLSTAEFVTAGRRPPHRPPAWPPLGLPLSNIGGPSPVAALGVSLFLGLGMVGPAVAKQADLTIAAEAIVSGARRPMGTGRVSRRAARRGHERDHRRPDRRDRRVGIHL
jgi:hypothetical protein